VTAVIGGCCLFALVTDLSLENTFLFFA